MNWWAWPTAWGTSRRSFPADKQQRVAIARALVGDPGLILADEPTGALDTKVGGAVFDLFLRLNTERHLTTVLITHDPGLAAKCKRQVRMVDGLIFDMKDDGERADAP